MPITNEPSNAFFHPSTTQPQRVKSINAYLLNNGFRLGKIIGEGSYSKVRICFRRNPEGKEQNTIACKIIDKRRASDDFVHKFLPRELQIVGRLRHPNIVSVLNMIEYDHNVFIFMDYCDNGDLLEFVKRKSFLSEDLSRHYFHQILLAVQYLHGLDLAHRDLKCENVLLTKQDLVKLSDFGFSRHCRDQTSGKRILSTTYCGSAAYAAPEILQGTKYNPKLYDMWSVGCILFIMLSGHMPFDESNIPKMLKNQTEGVLTYPFQVEKLISKSAKQFIRHLLEPDVTKRATIDQAIANSWFANYHPPPTPLKEATSFEQVEEDIGTEYEVEINFDKKYDEGDAISGIKPEDFGRLANKPSRSRHFTSSRARSRPSRYVEDRHSATADGKRAQLCKPTKSQRKTESTLSTGRGDTFSRTQVAQVDLERTLPKSSINYRVPSKR